MPTLVDALVVELRLDKSGVDLGRKQALDETDALKAKAGAAAAAIESSISKAVNESFKSVERRVLAFFAIMLGARSVQDFVANITKTETSLGILSDALGLAPRDLSAFEQAVERIGGSTEDAVQSLSSLNKTLNDIATGTQVAPEWFSRLGGYGIDLKSNPVEGLVQFSALVKRMGGDDSRKSYALGQMGIGQGTARFLMQGPEAVRAQLKDAGVDAITSGQVGAGTALNAGWAKASQASKSLGRNIVEAVQGPLTELLNKLTAWVEVNKGWISGLASEKMKEFKSWVDGLDWKKIGDTIKGVTDRANEFATAVGGWQNVIAGVGLAFATIKIASSISDISVAILAMTAAVGPVTAALTAALAAYEALKAGDAKAAPAPAPAAPQRAPETYRPKWLDPGSPGKALTGKPDGVALETAEGPVTEGRPMPIKLEGGQQEDDSFWGLLGRAFGQVVDWAREHLPFMGGSAGGNNAGEPGRVTLGGGRAIGKWWTPDRISYAVNRLQKEAGLSYWGAVGLVARWAGIEAAGGPTSANNIGGGHWGIGQWDRARGGPWLGAAPFEDQVTHSIKELNSTEKRAGDILRNAQTPEEGARGASSYERAEHYNPSTGTDDWTGRTPVRELHNFIRQKSPPVAPTVPKPAADAANSDARQSMLVVNKTYQVSVVEVHAHSAHGAGVAREIRYALQRELAGNLATG